jgi:hypothetical protein
VTRLILDPATAAKLDGTAGSIELCDPSGRTLGYFTPVVDRSLYQGVEIPFSEEELARAEKEVEGKTYTTDEVLAHLRSLEREEG